MGLTLTGALGGYLIESLMSVNVFGEVCQPGQRGVIIPG